MKHYSLYEKETGRILHTLYLPDRTNPILKDGLDLYSGHYADDKFWINNGVVENRYMVNIDKSSISTNEEVTMKNVPQGTKIVIDDEEYLYNENEIGEVSLSFPFDGEWVIEIYPPFPWIEQKIKIKVSS